MNEYSLAKVQIFICFYIVDSKPLGYFVNLLQR